MKEHPAEEISCDIDDHHPDSPDETFMWHLATGAPAWSLRRMIQNPGLYGNLKLDHKRCGEVTHENSGKILAQHKKGPKRRNDSDLRLGIHLPGVCMHADLAGPFNPVGIGGMRYILFVACAETLYLFAIPIKKEV